MRRVALAVGFVLGFTGCGGGGDRLSREEFVDRATAICERAEERVVELAKPNSLDELATYAREARAITEDGVGELEELEPPEPLEQGFEAYLEQADEVLGLLDELERAAETGDEEESARIARQLAKSAEAQQAARAAGLAACEDGS